MPPTTSWPWHPVTRSHSCAASIHARLEQRDKGELILRAGLSLFPHVERLQRCYTELAGAASKNPI